MNIFEKPIAILFLALMIAACSGNTSDDNAAAEALAAAQAKLAEMESELAAVSARDDEIAAVKKLIEIWDTADVEELDAIAIAEYTRTAPDQSVSKLEDLKSFIKDTHSVYPDFKITNDGIAAGADGVFVQWTVTGSDTGTSENPTGNSLEATGISRYRFQDGKIASELVIFDTGAVLTQLDRSELPKSTD